MSERLTSEEIDALVAIRRATGAPMFSITDRVLATLVAQRDDLAMLDMLPIGAEAEQKEKTMTNNELAASLRVIGQGMQAGITDATGMGMPIEQVAAANTVLSVATALLELGANIAESGHDPADVIRRIADVKPWLDATEARWADLIAKKPL